MKQKISYRIVFNHNNQTNKNGMSLIQIEARQGYDRKYFSTHLYVKKEQFKNGFVINHELSEKYNCLLINMKNNIEQIEIDSILYNNNYLTLSQLKDLYQYHSTPSALLTDFGKEIILSSDRKKSTQAGYDVFFNNIEKFRQNIHINDVDYNFIVSYDKWLKESGISDNTRIGRLQQLKTIMSEAVKREIIPINPFTRFKIPTMKNKVGFLTSNELLSLERLTLLKKEKIVRDAFLLGCYTGLRFSDIKDLKNDDINNGWIKKTMKKTSKTVEIPISVLFEGKAIQLIERYGNIEKLGKKLGQNGAANQILKNVFEKAGINSDGKTFHISRHTCATLLMQQGLQITTIQKILGHTKISTSMIYAEVTKDTILNDIKKNKKKKS